MSGTPCRTVLLSERGRARIEHRADVQRTSQRRGYADGGGRPPPTAGKPGRQAGVWTLVTHTTESPAKACRAAPGEAGAWSRPSPVRAVPYREPR